MKKCFGDKGAKCMALKRKKCENCAFYKPKDTALKELKESAYFQINSDLQKIYKEMSG